MYALSANTATVFGDRRKARLNPVLKKHDKTDRSNYRPLSMLSVPSKIMELCVADRIVQHAFTDNDLVTDKQWTYYKGHSTEILPAQLTETGDKLLAPN